MSVDILSREPQIEALLGQWLQRLAGQDPEHLAALYAPDAVLLPTISDQVARTPADIIDYFLHFMTGKPEGRLLDGTVRVMGDVAVHSGIYRFTMTALEGRPELDARFTFVYQRIADEWKIVAHHSSAMPEG